MLVYKFGGTSVGSVVNMNHVKDIINTQGKKIVVLSAMSGTTNALVEIATAIENNNLKNATTLINTLNETYNSTVYNLITDPELRQETSDYVNNIFSTLKADISNVYSIELYNRIVLRLCLAGCYNKKVLLQRCYLR